MKSLRPRLTAPIEQLNTALIAAGESQSASGIFASSYGGGDVGASILPPKPD